MTSSPSRRLVRTTALAVVAALLLAGCTLTDGRRVVESAVEKWTSPAFYTLPDPIPAGQPGDIVRQERIYGARNGAIAWRVLYHSTDVHGADILVSGTVVAPSSRAPKGGRPVVSWAHPTTGSAPRCAPSVGYAPFDLIEGLGELLDAGYVVASTDFPGMGAASPNSYLVGVSEGNSVLDAARAARQLPTGASNDLLLWGHSQGGQAALFAAQLAPSYAPELDLKAVAVAAPATNLGALLNDDIDDISGVTISSYAFAAYSEVYGAELSTILTPAGVAATPKMASLCLIGQNAKIHDIARPLVGSYFSGDPTKVEPWASLLVENTPGATRLDVPLFIAQGEDDALVDPRVTREFADHECSIGTAVTFVSISNTGHGLVAMRALDDLMPWFARALAGTEPVEPCAS